MILRVCLTAELGLLRASEGLCEGSFRLSASISPYSYTTSPCSTPKIPQTPFTCTDSSSPSVSGKSRSITIALTSPRASLP